MGDEYQNQTPETYGSMDDTSIYPRPPAPPARKQRSTASRILEFILIVCGAVLIALLMQAYVIKPFQIPTPSMVHTIEIGDRILADRLSYRFGEVQRGDIIVFKSPENSDIDFVKRVIAVGGDTVEVNNHMVIVNGEALVEPYINTWVKREPPFERRQVPEGKVFVMGDNRDDSQDSRFWDDPFLDEDAIIGKAIVTYWPPNRIGRF